MPFDRQRLKQDMYEFFKSPEIEGSVPHFYLDSVCKITVGIGHMVSDKEKFMDLANSLYSAKDPKVRATEKMMDTEWQRLGEKITECNEVIAAKKAANLINDKKVPVANNKSWRYYGKDANLKMDEEQIKKDTFDVIDEHIDVMLQLFPKIKDAPYPAQKATLNMVYNMGGPNLKRYNGVGKKRQPSTKKGKEGLLFKAIEKEDWKAAAKLCRLPQNPARNKKVSAMFQAAANSTENHTQLNPFLICSLLPPAFAKECFPNRNLSLKKDVPFRSNQSFGLNSRNYPDENQSLIEDVINPSPF